MKIRISSDWHFEFWDKFQLSLEDKIDLVLPYTPADKDSVLVLAGDIHYHYRVEEVLTYLSPKFKAIIYCPGNHEFYHFKYQQLKFDLPNVYTDELILDDYVFIARTLFSDIINNSDLHSITRSLNDFNLIKGMTVQAYQDIYEEHLAQLTEKIERYKDKKIIVCTHHAPSKRSINPKYTGSNINGAFYSDLDHLVKKVHLWIHGHMHDYCSYDNVICNPVGYPHEDSSYCSYKQLDI